MGFLNVILGAVAQGLIWSLLAMGVYITYRILDYADLTTEGSYPLGAAIAAHLIISGHSPYIAIFVSAIGGALAGFVTGFLNTKLKIPSLLSGILVMVGMYSVILRVMGKANLTLLNTETIITQCTSFLNTTTNAAIFVGIISVVITIILLCMLFSTELGFAIRATGDNEKMISAQGVNIDHMKILGLMISNGLIALCGAIMAQYNGYADVGMGQGTIVTGLASVIIGEVLFGKSSMLRNFISVVLGSILYRIIIALVLKLGLNPNDLRLLSSILLVFCLSLPIIKEKLFKNKKEVA